MGLGKGLEAIIASSGSTESLEMQVEKLQKVVKYLADELAIHRQRTEALTAEEMYLGAKKMIDNNPGIWHYLTYRARMCVRRGDRFSLWKEVENLRSSKRVFVEEHDVYKFNNSYTSTLLRFLFLEVPDAKKVTFYRNCKTDKYFNGDATPPTTKPKGAEQSGTKGDAGLAIKANVLGSGSAPEVDHSAADGDI